MRRGLFFYPDESNISRTPWSAGVLMYRPTILKLCILSTLLGGGVVQSADKVYKSTDARGNVVFTDVPPANVDQAEKATVEIREVNVYQPRTGRGDTIQGREPWIVEDADPGQEGEQPEFTPYPVLTIASPANDTPLRDNVGNVSVQVGIDPALNGAHRLRLLLDGNPVADATSTSFQLENVDRGTHSLSVEVVDEDGEVLQTSSTSTFHMQRYHKKPPPPATKPKADAP
jgi:Domain of unknown function (DUF4124)